MRCLLRSYWSAKEISKLFWMLYIRRKLTGEWGFLSACSETTGLLGMRRECGQPANDFSPTTLMAADPSPPDQATLFARQSQILDLSLTNECDVS